MPKEYHPSLCICNNYMMVYDYKRSVPALDNKVYCICPICNRTKVMCSAEGVVAKNMVLYIKWQRARYHIRGPYQYKGDNGDDYYQEFQGSDAPW